MRVLSRASVNGEQREPLNRLGVQRPRCPAKQLGDLGARSCPGVVGSGDEAPQVGVQDVVDVVEEGVGHVAADGVPGQRLEQVLGSLSSAEPGSEGQ